MEWADVGRAVAKSAPVLGSVLGGPVGAIAGAAGSMIASALGCEPDPEAVQRTIAQSPDLLLKLKDLEIEQQAQLLQWQRDQVQAELTDRMSARDREVELAKSGHGATWATSIVACIVTVGFFIMLWTVLRGGKAELGDAGLMLLGTLASAFGAVVQYYLGSSLGSASKDAYLKKIRGGGRDTWPLRPVGTVEAVCARRRFRFRGRDCPCHAEGCARLA